MNNEVHRSLAQTSIRKRLMYVTQEDFYFLTYCLLLILKQIGCTKEDKLFKDIRKLAFCVDLVSDSELILLLL